MSRIMPLGVKWQTASFISLSPQSSNRRLKCSKVSRVQAASSEDAISNFGAGLMDGNFEEVESGGEEQGLEWVWKAGERLEKEINDEAENRKHAETVGVDDLEQGGVHIQGRRMIKTEVYVDEDDKRRHVWHRKLHLCAEQGDYSGAEEVLAKMKDQKHRPGPKAHHALIISYVKGGNPGGALKAIREAWKSKWQSNTRIDVYYLIIIMTIIGG
jgi:pentatricopeptide repeat protein